MRSCSLSGGDSLLFRWFVGLGIGFANPLMHTWGRTHFILLKPCASRNWNWKSMIQETKKTIENVLYPELRSYGRSDRDRLLREAAKMPFDLTEWVGVLTSLVLVVMLTRYSAIGFGIADRMAVTAVNFFVAIPLLGVTAGPFLVRRTRRGLRSQIR